MVANCLYEKILGKNENKRTVNQGKYVKGGFQQKKRKTEREKYISSHFIHCNFCCLDNFNVFGDDLICKCLNNFRRSE